MVQLRRVLASAYGRSIVSCDAGAPVCPERHVFGGTMQETQEMLRTEFKMKEMRKVETIATNSSEYIVPTCPRLDRDGMGRTWNNRWHTGATCTPCLSGRDTQTDLLAFLTSVTLGHFDVFLSLFWCSGIAILNEHCHPSRALLFDRTSCGSVIHSALRDHRTYFTQRSIFERSPSQVYRRFLHQVKLACLKLEMLDINLR